MKHIILSFLLTVNLASAIGGTQIGNEAAVAFGEEAVFKVLVSGNPAFSIEKPGGWEVKIEETGKEYVSAGNSYLETRAYEVRIKPGSPSGTVAVMAIEKGDGKGIRVDESLRFSFFVAVKSSVLGHRESSVKKTEEREIQAETSSPRIPAGIVAAAIAPLLWIAARKLAKNKTKMSGWKV